MTFDYELTLISITYDENELGDPITIEEKVVVWCDKQSVTRSEYYSAAAHGLPPEIVFVINQYEYDGQKYVEFEGEKYRVTRAFQPKKSKGIGDFETIEIVCQGVVNNG